MNPGPGQYDLPEDSSMVRSDQAGPTSVRIGEAERQELRMEETQRSGNQPGPGNYRD